MNMIEESNNQCIEKIINFMEDRISRIMNNETPLPFYKSAKIVLHLIPIISYKIGQNFDLTQINWAFNGIKPIRPNYSTWDYEICANSYIAYNKPPEENMVDSYIEIFTNGIIEAVDGYILKPRNNDLWIRPIMLENHIIKSIGEYLTILQNLNIELPIYLYLNLLGINGYKVYVHEGFEGHLSSEIIEDDRLFTPEVIINNYNSRPEDILKKCFDAIWQASGLKGSYNYYQSGERKQRPYKE